MNRKKLYLWVQSLLCVLIVLLLAVNAIALYREGVAARAEDPLAQIFSRETVAGRLRQLVPLIGLGVGLAVAGLILDVKDGRAARADTGGKVQHPAEAPGAKTLRTVLLIAAVCLLLAGIINGGAQEVYAKAVKLCTECVGLG